MVAAVARPAFRWIESGTRLEYAWVAFALLNLAAMLAIIEIRFGQGWETVPFHFIYVSFTLLYGFRAWRGRVTFLGIAFVTISTGAVTAFGIHRNWESPPEFTEVPLMSLMFVAMVYHVRRRQQAQAVAEALAAERERDLERKSVFLSDASHELLTPITIGRGHLELLRRDRPSRLHRGDRDVRGGAGRARPDGACDQPAPAAGVGRRGRRRARSSEVDAVRPRHARTFQRWRGTADRDWQLGDVPPGTVAVDLDQLTLALDALVENAVQHTRPGQPIEIGAAAVDGTLRIRVRDGGDGIPEEAQARVFDRFYRVDGSRNRRHGGVGLGLAIVKAVVEAHGGRVSVSSRPGEGSTFELSPAPACAQQGTSR